MKKIQAKLIKLLKEDARYTAEELAAMVGESEENVKRELRALEESGVIVKYTAITNSELENAGVVEALIEVKVTPKNGSKGLTRSRRKSTVSGKCAACIS